MRVGLTRPNQTVLNGYPETLIPAGDSDLVVGGQMIGLVGATVQMPAGTASMVLSGLLVAITRIRVVAPVARTIMVCRDRRRIVVTREVCE